MGKWSSRLTSGFAGEPSMRGDGFLYRDPRSPYWWASWSVGGNRYRKSTGERQERRARAWLREAIIDSRVSGAPAKDSKSLTVGRLLELRRKEYQRKGNKSIDTLDTLLKIVLAEFKGERRALDLTTKRLEAFFDDLLEKYSQSTVRQVSLHLSGAFAEAVRRGEFSQKDLPHVRKISEPKNARLRAPSREELAAFTAAAPIWLSDFVWFAFFSGWRSGEIKGLTWSDYDSDKVIHLQDSKSGKPRILPLAGALLDIVERRRAEKVRPMAGGKAHIFSRNASGAPLGDIRKAWERNLRASGVERFTPHDIRRSAARFRRQTQGIDSERVQRMFGWSSGKMLTRYNIVDTENLRAVLDSDCIQSPELSDSCQTETAE